MLPMLCPMCIRKLHMHGKISDVPPCLARVQEVLEEEGLQDEGV